MQHVGGRWEAVSSSYYPPAFGKTRLESEETDKERERSFPEGRRKDEAARSSRVEPTWQGGRSCEGAKRPFQYGILVPTARGAALPHLTGERWSRTSQARGHFNAGRQREWSTLHLLCLCEVAAQPSSQIHPPARCED